MKGKMLLLVGAAIGYVLGSRAGHERYEQLKAGAERAWHDPRVQDKVSEAEHAIKEKVSDAEQAVKAAAPQVQAKIVDAASSVADTVKSAMPRETTSEPSVGPGTIADDALGDVYRPSGSRNGA